MVRTSQRRLVSLAIAAALAVGACSGASTASPAATDAGGSQAPEPSAVASGSASAQGEVVLTCTGCEDSETDIFIAETHRLSEAFNEAYAGRYRIETVPFAGINDLAQSVPYLKRLAASDTLPDLWWGGGYVMTDLAKSGRLVDWAPYLDADPAWKDSFYPDAFLSLTDAEGHIWGIPSFRDAIGIFWNKEQFAAAGLTEFPTTWEAFVEACSAIKASGVTPLAMDGQWVTLLWWANLIGTQPGGAEFLKGSILEGDFSALPVVVDATERLKQLHTDGYVNPDAFSGDFFAADNQFLTEKAAMLANGPWEIPSGIKGANANPGLYDKLGYAIAPGDGVIVVAGTGSWASAAKTPEKVEAALEFMKFMNTPEQQLIKYANVGGAWPTDLALTNEQLAETLDPLYLPVFQASTTVPHTFPYPQFLTPSAFVDEWKNNWPGYVQGAISTEEFLGKLAAAAAS